MTVTGIEGYKACPWTSTSIRRREESPHDVEEATREDSRAAECALMCLFVVNPESALHAALFHAVQQELRAAIDPDAAEY